MLSATRSRNETNIASASAKTNSTQDAAFTIGPDTRCMACSSPMRLMSATGGGNLTLDSGSTAVSLAEQWATKFGIGRFDVCLAFAEVWVQPERRRCPREMGKVCRQAPIDALGAVDELADRPQVLLRKAAFAVECIEAPPSVALGVELLFDKGRQIIDRSIALARSQR